MRRVLLLVVALVVAGGAAWFSKRALERASTQPVVATAPVPQLREVLVAAKPFAPGEFVRADWLRWQAWPDVDIPDEYVTRDDEPLDAEGAVARRPVTAGEPVTRALLVQPGDRGFLAAVLAPGMRAISVGVDEVSSSAGLIHPGDRVDLLLAQTIAPGGEGDVARRVAETVLEDVRVLAMGRSLAVQAEGELAAPAGQVRTATLEVTPEGAERVALLGDLGRLSISLRSLAVPPAGEPAQTAAARRLTWDDQVAHALASDRSTTLTVFRGREAEPVTLHEEGEP